MQLESSGDLLSKIYFLLTHPTEHLFLTSFNLTRALQRVQVYLNYFHSTGIPTLKTYFLKNFSKNLLSELLSLSTRKLCKKTMYGNVFIEFC